MKKEYKKEELLENLPDYINNVIYDVELKETIRKEIETNPDFKNEFDLISFTLKNVNNFSFSEPPVNYFTSLLPRINDKIHKKSETFGFFKNLSTFWKLAIPVVTIIIFFISYKTFFNNNEFTNKLNNSIVLNTDTQKNIKTNNTELNKEEELTSEETENMESIEETSSKNISTYYSRHYPFDNKSNLIKNDENIEVSINFSDNIPDEEVFYSTEDEENVEQEFDRLNAEEQNNIISKINNSNL
jgi:hypothetical protein